MYGVALMEKLKPCPFCGGKGKVKAAKKDNVGFTIWCECEKCHAIISGMLTPGLMCGHYNLIV